MHTQSITTAFLKNVNYKLISCFLIFSLELFHTRILLIISTIPWRCIPPGSWSLFSCLSVLLKQESAILYNCSLSTLPFTQFLSIGSQSVFSRHIQMPCFAAPQNSKTSLWNKVLGDQEYIVISKWNSKT